MLHRIVGSDIDPLVRFGQTYRQTCLRKRAGSVGERKCNDRSAGGFDIAA